MPEQLQQPAEKSRTELTKLVTTTEDTLRGLSLVPKAVGPSPMLRSSTEASETKVKDLPPVAKKIDELFGLTETQLRERLERDIGQVRQNLSAMSSQKVGGEERYGEHAQQLMLKLNEVQVALANKDFEGAQKAFGEVRAGIETLSEVIGTARRLVAAGAPAELVGSTDVALEFFRTGKQDRAELLMGAAKIFLENKEMFATAEGKPELESLVSFSLGVSDETKQVDMAAATGMLGEFRSDLAYPPEVRAADMEALSKGAALLGPATTEKIAASVGRLMEEGEAERARTLAGMTLKYIETAQTKGADLDTMKSALVRYADTGAQEAVEQFGETVARTVFAADMSKLKGAVGSWTQSAQKNVAQKAIEKTEELVGQKRYEEAAKLITYTAAYADSVATLGMEKRPATPEAVGAFSTMARALGAVERGEATVDGRDVGAVFAESTDTVLHMGQASALARNYSEVRQKFDGSAPWTKGAKPGMIPVGQGEIELATLREFEAKSGDAALAKGPTMQQLLAACGTAARSGNGEAYGKALDALSKRFALTTSRYLATQMATGFDQMAQTTDAVRASYGEHVPADVAKRLDSIKADTTALANGLRSGTAANDQIQNLRYNALANALRREQAVAMMGAQLSMNESYRETAKGITGGMAGVSLRDSSEQLLNARRELLNGNIPAAREYYEAAMSSRQAALATYSAAGKEKQFGGGPALALFDRWRQAHMDIFDGVLAGKDTSKLQERTGLVELSVFTLPENARGILDFSTRQKEIRELALSGRTQEANAAWDGMKKTLQVQKFWTNAALTVAGVAVGFVPGGQLASGAIFMSMATSQAIEEKNETGRVSGMTWGMIGVTVATLGMGGAISSLRTASLAAKMAEKTTAAARYGTAATGLTVTTLGAGAVMTGLSIPATIEAYREGRYGEVGFNIAMMAFPFAHMAGSGVTAKIGAARAKTVAKFEARMKQALTETTAPTVKIPVIKTRGVQAPTLAKPEQVSAAAVAKVAPKGPAAKAKLEERVRASKAEETVSQEKFDAWVAEQSQKGELMIGDNQTGAIIKSVEQVAITAAKGGVECDFIVLGGDKRALNWINNQFGTEWGNKTLNAYFETEKRIVNSAGAKVSSHMLRVRATSDETITILAIEKGKGAEVRASLVGKNGIVERVGKEVGAEYMQPDHPDGLAPLKGLVKDPDKLVAGSFDIGEVMQIRKGANGEIEAIFADKTRRPAEGSLSRLCTIAEEVEGGSASHAPALRKELNIREADTYVKDKRITDVSNGDPEKGIPPELVGGTAFEVRYEVTDKAVLREISGLLKTTDKGLAEISRNWFGIRGLNTFFGHYGTNSVLNVGERAVADYAQINGLSMKRLGTHKYIVENATKKQLDGLYEFITKRMDEEGVKLRASNRGPMSPKLDDVMGHEALTSISNGHLQCKWGTGTYEDANAIISSIGLSNEPTLAKLFGPDYKAMQEIVGIVRKNPAIRNVEDLLIALKDPSIVGGLKGRLLTGRFEKYIVNKGEEFRARLEGLAPAAAESGEQARLVNERGEIMEKLETEAPAAPAPMAAQARTALFMVDTSYVLDRLREGMPLYETFSKLSKRGEVVITRQVMDEIEKNLPAYGSKVRKAAIDDIYRCVNEKKLSIEKVDVPPEYVRRLSNILGSRSEKGNRRVGLGEASLIRYAKSMGKELFDITILHRDSDVPLLLSKSNIKNGGG